MFRFQILFLIASLIPILLKAQISKERIERHVYFLADDSLEGRMTGSPGEKIAYEYITNRFKEIGLKQYPEAGSFIHNFSYRSGKVYGEGNHLSIHGTSLIIDEDYYPLSYSGNGSVSTTAVYMNHGLEKDYIKKCEDKAVIIEYSLPSDIDPHSEQMEVSTLRNRLEIAAGKGANSVLVINTREEESDPEKGYDKNIFPMDIPVVFLKDHVVEKIDFEEEIIVNLSADLIQIFNEGNNVIAYLDNPSKKLVVVGAHYDHLGWGIQGSRYRGEEPMIHNGADDNASGVALMIELARDLKQKDLNYDYCFIAFSGEELGLYGSKAILDDELITGNKINYMLNMDMVGRLDNEEKGLAVNGVGTSPIWEKELDNSNTGGLNLKTKEAGTGPSDHANFYFNDIPVLHFFTGTHQDYHHPDDDAEKLNYEGIAEIGQLISNLIVNLDDESKLVFQKTKDESTETPRFTVTLGVMPDYMFDGKGMRIDGVTEGKVASHAGLEKGDIVLKIGDQNVVDLMTYMEGLSKYKKGDSTTVLIDRNGDLKEYQITFE